MALVKKKEKDKVEPEEREIQKELSKNGIDSRHTHRTEDTLQEQHNSTKQTKSTTASGKSTAEPAAVIIIHIYKQERM